MKPRAITLTVIFDAMSGNYGETVGNVSELKKISKKGSLYSFISRQAIRYELWKFLKKQFEIDTPEYWKSISEELYQQIVDSSFYFTIYSGMVTLRVALSNTSDKKFKKLKSSLSKVELWEKKSPEELKFSNRSKLLSEFKRDFPGFLDLLDEISQDKEKNKKQKDNVIVSALKEIWRLLTAESEKEVVPPPEILHVEPEVVQFHPSVNALNCVEADLFGYMKTQQGENAATRSAVVRLSPAISLEPMLLDTEFGTNKNFADRVGANPNPFQLEHHSSLYTYTVTVDLDRLGCEFDRSGKKIAELPKEEKLRRVEMVLDALPFLIREVKGRTENLSPFFVIGGVYPVKNPFFMGRVNVSYNRNTDKYSVNTAILKSVFSLAFKGEPVGKYTHCGFVSGFWENDFEKELQLPKGNFIGDIAGFFSRVKEEVRKGLE